MPNFDEIIALADRVLKAGELIKNKPPELAWSKILRGLKDIERKQKQLKNTIYAKNNN